MRKRTFVGWLACGMGILLAGCQGPKTFQPPSLDGTELSYYWQFPLELNRGEKVAQLWLVDENLYCLTSTNRLIAIDAQRGLTRWSYQAGTEIETIYRPAHPSAPVSLPMRSPGAREVKTFDAVVFNTMSRLIVLDRATGQEIRNIDLAFAANSGGACDNVNFYCGSLGGLYYCVDLDRATEVWRLRSDAMITAPLVILDEKLVVASEDHHVYVSGLNGREKMWLQQLGGAVVAPFYADNREMFIPCDDGKLYAFRTAAGQPMWEPFACRKPLVDAVQVGVDTVFQYARGDKFYAIDLRTGTALWSMPEGRAVLALLDGNVFLLDDARNLKKIEPSRGQVRASVSLAKFDVFLPNTTAPAIYAATRNGTVACIRPTAAGQLTPDMLRKSEKPVAAPQASTNPS